MGPSCEVFSWLSSRNPCSRSKPSSYSWGCLLGWHSLTNYSHHMLGRIWITWQDDVAIQPVYISSQLIGFKCGKRDIGVYAPLYTLQIYSGKERILEGSMCSTYQYHAKPVPLGCRRRFQWYALIYWTLSLGWLSCGSTGHERFSKCYPIL